MTGFTYPIVGPFEHRCWTGLVFSPKPRCGAAFRLGLEHDTTRIDGLDLVNTIMELGPAGVVGPYGRITLRDPHQHQRTQESPAHDTDKPGLIWEWVRRREDLVTARAKVFFPGYVVFTGFFPWGWSGSWSADDARLSARMDDEKALHVVTAIETTFSPPPGASVIDGGSRVRLRIPVNGGDVIRLTCVLSRAEETIEACAPKDIDHWIESARVDQETSRTTTTGVWRELPESVTNCLEWTTLLDPETGTFYTPAGRKWIFPTADGQPGRWTVFAWDSFFNGLEQALEHPGLVEPTLRSVLATQYPNGNIPNWRADHGGTPDRSQPPIGSFAALKCYLRTRDQSLLRLAQPYLERWSSWWSASKGSGRRRQAGRHGLFQWGSDVALRSPTPPPWEVNVAPRQYAAWESGQDDLPHWDEATWNQSTETLEMDVVDLNCYLALDLECLARIAFELGQADRERAFRSMRDDLIARINEHLWDSSRGMYADRFWTGGFSKHLGAANFLPLLAGVPDRDRATTMLDRLMGPAFWGPFVIPSVSRDDAAFDDQVYWRGSVWPPLNYLIYQGLKRYRFDEAAAALAQRSVDMFLTARTSTHPCPEHYDSRTGRGLGHRFQSWGPLLALMGIEEFIDVTPWDGIRIGTITPPPDSTLHRVRVAGHSLQIEYVNGEMKVTCDGIRFNAGAPIVLRHVEISLPTFRADCTTNEPVPIRAPGASIEIDGVSVSIPATVPPGEHRLLIRYH